MLNWIKLTQHFQKLQTRFENILHEDFGAKDSEIQKIKTNFAVSTDEALIRALSIGLPEAEDERTMVVFSRLSSFFEIGFFCLTEIPQTQPRLSLDANPISQVPIVFLYGQLKAISEKNTLQLPSVGPSKTLRSNQDKLWKDLSVYKWIRGERLTSLLIQLDHKHSFVLFSRLADPWLKIHFDKIHNEILKV